MLFMLVSCLFPYSSVVVVYLSSQAFFLHAITFIPPFFLGELLPPFPTTSENGWPPIPATAEFFGPFFPAVGYDKLYRDHL